jgi:acyl-CoA synthetase (AMP-forming)/AMP-acid ligase II
MVEVPSTMLEAMRARASSERGIRFHDSAEESVFLSYRQLDQDARHNAVELFRYGVRPGDRVVLAYDPSIDFVRAVYASFYAGAVVVPVPLPAVRASDAARERVLQIHRDSGARLVLTTPRVSERLGGELPAWQCLSHYEETDLAAAWQEPGTTSDDVAILQYTSGSTGTPKGVTITHRNLVANQEAIQTAVEYDQDTIMCGWLPHYHDMGLIGQYLQSVYTGFDLVATSPLQFLRRPALWLQLITRYRATTTVAPDFAYRLCTKLVTDEQLAALDLSSIVTAATGAEPVHASTLQRFSERFSAAGFDQGAFKPAYGMAESTLLISVKRTGEPCVPLMLDARELEAGRAVPARSEAPSLAVVRCGPPAPHQEVVVVSPDSGASLPDGMVGEIWVRGASVSVGYWENEPATRKVFGAQVGGAAGYLRTGDLGFLMDGEVAVTGRLDDVINLRGRNIYPSDLESAVARRVSSHGEAVAAAFTTTDDVVTVVVEKPPRGGVLLSVDEVRTQVARDFSLSRFNVVLVSRGAIPTTTSGKVQRRAAHDKLVSGEFSVLSPGGDGSAAAKQTR